MDIARFQSLACPLDGAALSLRDNSLVCTHNHCFDLDRKGAVNLLPVQFKKSLEPGDSKEMVDARRLFLQSGTYQPISDRLNALIDTYMYGGSFACLDAGCGEGYYLSRLADHVQQNETNSVVQLAGLDISKHAVRAALSLRRDVMWMVGTNAHLPIADASLDIVLCLFGFPVWSEFLRVLKPNGRVVCVDPSDDHLIEMRRVLYADIKEKNSAAFMPEGFVKEHDIRLHEQVPPVSGEMLYAQIMMTPHGFRASREAIDKAVQTSFDAMTLDVVFSVYQKDSSLLG